MVYCSEWLSSLSLLDICSSALLTPDSGALFTDITYFPDVTFMLRHAAAGIFGLNICDIHIIVSPFNWKIRQFFSRLCSACFLSQFSEFREEIRF